MINTIQGNYKLRFREVSREDLEKETVEWCKSNAITILKLLYNSAVYSKYEASFLYNPRDVKKFEKANIIVKVYCYTKAFFKYILLAGITFCSLFLGNLIFIKSNLEEIYKALKATLLKKDISYNLCNPDLSFENSFTKANIMLLNSKERIQSIQEKTQVFSKHLEETTNNKQDIYVVFIANYENEKDNLADFGAMHNYNLLRSMNQISKTQHVVMRYIKSTNDINSHLSKIQKDFPKKTIRNIEISSHGAPNLIHLQNEHITSENVQNLGLSTLRKPVNLILSSCLTGYGEDCIAQEIANSHENVTVFASDSKITNGVDVRFDKETNSVTEVYFNTWINRLLPFFKTPALTFKKEITQLPLATTRLSRAS